MQSRTTEPCFFGIDDIASLNVKYISHSGAHWTMFCGNDEMVGHAEVAVPATVWLLLTGMQGLMDSVVAKYFEAWFRNI